MEDLAYDKTSGALLTKRLASGRPLAVFCHAPAVILATVDKNGKTPFAGPQPSDRLAERLIADMPLRWS